MSTLVNTNPNRKISSIFQRIFVASDLEEAAMFTLKKWYSTYIHEVERQLALPKNRVPPPVNYTSRNKFTSLQGEEMPKVVVISPGLITAPHMDGTKQYQAVWRLGVGVAMTASSEREVNMLAKVYGAATRALMIDKLGRDNPDIRVLACDWIDETYDDLPIPDQLELYKAANIHFAVTVINAVTKVPGPDTPDADPYADYGEVEHVYIDGIIKIPLDENLPEGG